MQTEGGDSPGVSLDALKVLVGELPCLSAARALKGLACDVDAEDPIRIAGGIEALVQCLVGPAAKHGDGGDALVEAACGALQNLASDDNEANQAAVRHSGGLEALARVLGDCARPKGCRNAAASALRNLRSDSANAAALDALAPCLPGAARAACDDDDFCGGPRCDVPNNWDSAVRFTDALLYNDKCLETTAWAVFAALRATPAITASVRIEKIEEEGHPCKGQRGLFAAQPLPAGTLVLRYCGVAKARCQGETGDYLFGLKRYRGQAGGEEICVDVDAALAGNESRFINDYRGVAARPNVQFVETRSALGAADVWVQVLRAVSVDEEILVSYGSRYFPPTNSPRARVQTEPATRNAANAEPQRRPSV